MKTTMNLIPMFFPSSSTATGLRGRSLGSQHRQRYGINEHTNGKRADRHGAKFGIFA
jgi:hypothetical protein